jgi:hypothetical protein
MTSDETTLQEVQGFLALLAADPLSTINTDDVAALLALTNTQVFWWKANDFDKPIGVSDLIAAGNLF